MLAIYSPTPEFPKNFLQDSFWLKRELIQRYTKTKSHRNIHKKPEKVFFSIVCRKTKEIKILVSVVYFGLLRNVSILSADSLDADYTSVLIFIVGVIFSIPVFFSIVF
jgi:hypothetical protein